MLIRRRMQIVQQERIFVLIVCVCAHQRDFHGFGSRGLHLQESGLGRGNDKNDGQPLL